MYWPNETYGSSLPCLLICALPLVACLAGFRRTSASLTGRGLCSLKAVVAGNRALNLRTPSAAPNWFIFEFGFARGSGSEDMLQKRGKQMRLWTGLWLGLKLVL